MAFSSLLMVKDFDSSGFTVDNAFMTNADVPTLATDGLFKDPVNPFTGKSINNAAKEAGELLLYRGQWDPRKTTGNTFLSGRWFTVHDDIFDKNNWKELESD